MPYEVYKVLHISAIFVFLTSASVLLVSERKTKFWKIVTGVSSFLILFAGMGLLARLGGGFPTWVILKLVLWLVITGLGHMVAKRFPAQGVTAYWVTVALAISAAAIAVYKPFL